MDSCEESKVFGDCRKKKRGVLGGKSVFGCKRFSDKNFMANKSDQRDRWGGFGELKGGGRPWKKLIGLNKKPSEWGLRSHQVRRGLWGGWAFIGGFFAHRMGRSEIKLESAAREEKGEKEGRTRRIDLGGVMVFVEGGPELVQAV